MASDFEHNFKSLERLWAAISPDPCLYLADTNTTGFAEYMSPGGAAKRGGRDTYGELAAKTRQVIQENTTFVQIAESLPVACLRRSGWKRTTGRRGVNCVVFENGCIKIKCVRRTPPTRTLENWLRRQARAEIERYLEAVTKRLRRSPGKLYIMDQRTKWGNCSSLVIFPT